ncbi:MAG TPA: hypothetical protein VMV57_12110, partial [Terracidiphilus sp.]|nr:hypothetical protein [Terracidiphilus sp.]
MRIPTWQPSVVLCFRRHGRALCSPPLLWTLAAGILLSAAPVTRALQTSPPPAHPRIHHRTAHARVPSAPVPPPAPVLPNWPINNQPNPATVTFNSQGLRVVASNSSLSQILEDISTTTGATVKGFSSDQRVFGEYGPGTPR